MLEYDRIDISEGIDVNKCKNISTKCSLCKFYYFLDKTFNYGPYSCDGCDDMSLKVINMKNLAIVYCVNPAYRINFTRVSKNEEHYNVI